MRSVPISHSITGPLARSIGPGFTGAERGKALTNAGGLSGPPFGVHYSHSPRFPPLGFRCGGGLRFPLLACNRSTLFPKHAAYPTIQSRWSKRRARRGFVQEACARRAATARGVAIVCSGPLGTGF